MATARTPAPPSSGAAPRPALPSSPRAGASRPAAPPPFPRPLPHAPAAPPSSLARALEARGPRYRIVPISGLFGLGGKPLEHIGILYAHGRDSEAALFAAHRSLAEQVSSGTGRGAVSAAEDAELLTTAKIRELLFRLCRAVDPAQPDRLKTTADGLHTYPAFPSPGWMRDHLGPEDDALLLRLVDEVRSEFRPRQGATADPWPAEDVDALAGELARAALTGEAPGAGLVHLSRAELVELTARLAERLVDAQRARDALLEGSTSSAPAGDLRP